jgi:hypothetical protein
VLDDGDLIDHAITEIHERLTQREGEQQSELAAIQDKLTETRAALDRYFPRVRGREDARGHLCPARSEPQRAGQST